jgi:hypothetical protein
MSLVTLIPKWSGTDTAIPLSEFFESIEGTARLGNWSEAHQVQVCALRLTDTARVFYSATPELRGPNVSWQNFKNRFLEIFKDVRTAQYHNTRLLTPRRKRDEMPNEFLDRLRILAR